MSNQNLVNNSVVVAPNMAPPSRDFTVEEHLLALGGAPEWVVALGNAIQQITSCDPAVAASRARDMSTNASVSRGVEHLVTGWLEIQPALSGGLTPWQKSTLLMVVEGICKTIKGDLSSPK